MKKRPFPQAQNHLFRGVLLEQHAACEQLPKSDLAVDKHLESQTIRLCRGVVSTTSQPIASGRVPSWGSQSSHNGSASWQKPKTLKVHLFGSGIDTSRRTSMAARPRMHSTDQDRSWSDPRDSEPGRRPGSPLALRMRPVAAFLQSGTP
jgi:hypothetical protein